MGRIRTPSSGMAGFYEYLGAQDAILASAAIALAGIVEYPHAVDLTNFAQALAVSLNELSCILEFQHRWYPDTDIKLPWRLGRKRQPLFNTAPNAVLSIADLLDGRPRFVKIVCLCERLRY